MGFNSSLLDEKTIKSFVDRQLKQNKAKSSVAIKRHEVQEDIAIMLGYKNWHQLSESLKFKKEPSSPSVKDFEQIYPSKKVIEVGFETPDLKVYLFENARWSLESFKSPVMLKGLEAARKKFITQLIAKLNRPYFMFRGPYSTLDELPSFTNLENNHGDYEGNIGKNIIGSYNQEGLELGLLISWYQKYPDGIIIFDGFGPHDASAYLSLLKNMGKFQEKGLSFVLGFVSENDFPDTQMYEQFKSRLDIINNFFNVFLLKNPIEKNKEGVKITLEVKKDIEESLSKLSKYYENFNLGNLNDIHQFMRDAHTLKGLMGTLGYMEIRRVFYELYKLAESITVDGKHEELFDYNKFNVLYHRATSLLHNLIKN